MIRVTRNILWHLCSWCAACGSAFGGTVDSFDDIVYWIGSGANRAAIVIDFDGDAANDLSLVWGFRWDGPAFGRDMLNAVVTADARLFARIGNSSTQLGGVMGLGYDRTDDGEFDIDAGGPFDAAGFAYGSPNEDAAAVDTADWYREGWFDHFWHYGLSDGNPWTSGRWVNAQSGASTRPLHDGDWDSWAFTLDADNPTYYTTIFARNPVIATPPGGYADFDANGIIDGADFLSWQRGLSLTNPAPMQGDANGDGHVGAIDLAVWRSQFASGAATPLATAAPEPLSWTTCASAMLLLFHPIRLQRIRQLRRSAS